MELKWSRPVNLVGKRFDINSHVVRVLIFLTGLLLVLVALVYYINYRVDKPYFLDLAHETYRYLYFPNLMSPPEYAVWTYAIPTFLHVLSFSLFTIAAFPHRRLFIYGAPVFWLTINLGFEIAQGNKFSWVDVYAAILATLLLFAIIKLLFKINDGRTHCSNRISIPWRTTITSLLILLGMISISASYPCDSTSDNLCKDKTQPEEQAQPIYLSYDNLRNNSIQIADKKPLTETGKIYLYRHYILISNPNDGIHIYDNSDPQNPIHLLYINIPGNLDIAVKGDFLYVDSYIDLVALDISNIDTNINSVVETHRIKDIFPYDAYQNIPDGIYLGPIDKSKGVVVGYTYQ